MVSDSKAVGETCHLASESFQLSSKGEKSCDSWLFEDLQQRPDSLIPFAAGESFDPSLLRQSSLKVIATKSSRVEMDRENFVTTLLFVDTT